MKYKLYHGSSHFLSLEATHEQIDSIKSKKEGLEVLTINADTLDSQSILDALTSQNLFVSERILFIKRLYKNKKKEELIPAITEILENSTSKDTVIIWEDQKIKSNTKYYKFFGKDKKVEGFDELNKRTFFTWLREELKKQGMKMEAVATKEIAERTNYDPERCANELKKLKLMVDDNEIKKEDVEKLITNTLERDIWGLIESINEGDTKKSTKILEKLLSQAVDVNFIISMIARNLRLITLTKFLVNEGKSSSEIASILKVIPITVPSLIRESEDYSEKKITYLYTKLSNLDYQIKRGLIEPKLGITLLSSVL